MKMYEIEVDEEVYQYIKSKAEVFVDIDANSVLRKLLLGKQVNNSHHNKPAMELPNFSKAIPDALTQLLELIYLVNNGEDRVNALAIVANRHNINKATVADKYIRGLGQGMNTTQFDRMLEESGYSKLESVLKERFHAHKDYIENFFKNLNAK